MMLTGLLREALISISASRLRTFLAVLGIVIGVASVVLMLAVGTGSQRSIETAISKLGSNVLIVTPGARSNNGLRTTDISALTMKDAAAMAELPSIAAASPITASREIQIAAGKLNWDTRVIGVTPDYFYIREWGLTEGNHFNDEEMRLGKRVAIIGSTIVNKLFPNTVAIGGVLRVNGMPFTVIGVLESKGQDFSGRDQDDIVYMPTTTVQSKLLGSNYAFGIVQGIYTKVISREVMDMATMEISELLRERHKLRGNEADDFTVHNLTSITQTATDTSRAMAMLLGAIASISLIVGGIGIMNIMLVTVTERTREIGIRKAIGANDHQIMLQFLLEAMLIALSGCFIGLAIGFGGGLVVHHWMDIPIEFSLWSAVVALIVAVTVGLLSGIYPAFKAARLQPIEALRAIGA